MLLSDLLFGSCVSLVVDGVFCPWCGVESVNFFDPSQGFDPFVDHAQDFVESDGIGAFPIFVSWCLSGGIFTLILLRSWKGVWQQFLYGMGWRHYHDTC